jgi:hypothetical protein
VASGSLHRSTFSILFCILPFCVQCFLACALSAPAASGQSPQTDADHYTRYELLAPGSAKFRIIYEVTATTAGATRYFNPIRRQRRDRRVSV